MRYSLATGTEPTPTHRNYWVVPERFLAGSYPGQPNELEHRSRLEKLWQAGARSFLNLMEVGEVNNAGEPFRPYWPTLEEFAQRDGDVLFLQRLPIVDNHIPAIDRMVSILDELDHSLERDCVTYLHCFGGVGRTATVVGCWLVRHGFATPEAVLEHISRLREADTRTRHRAAPETSIQCAFVTSWRPGQ